MLNAGTELRDGGFDAAYCNFLKMGPGSRTWTRNMNC